MGRKLSQLMDKDFKIWDTKRKKIRYFDRRHCMTLCMYLHNYIKYINKVVKINKEPYSWVLLCHSKSAEHISFVTDCPQCYWFFINRIRTGNYGDVPQGNRRHFQPWPTGDYLTFSEAKKKTDPSEVCTFYNWTCSLIWSIGDFSLNNPEVFIK